MRTAAYMRTHHWDAATRLCFDGANAALGGGLRLLADVTTPFDLPQLPALTFRREDFPPLGLPLRPNPDRALWFNGDYPLYLAAEADDADFFLMIDGDCLVNGLDLQGLLARLMALGVDFCAPFVAECGPQDWPHWAGLQRAWFDEELGPGHTARVVKSFFPFVFLSRRALGHLVHRRRQMAEAKRGGIKALWPQCESFVPSELARVPGWSLRALETFVPAPMHMTFKYPLGLSEVAGSGHCLIHPLLAGRRLGEKILFAIAEDAPDDPPRQAALLRRALARRLDPEALAVLTESLAVIAP